MDIQGGLGQLFAARTLLNRFPGRRLRFEVSRIRREVDILMEGGPMPVAVEVKTNLTGQPSFDKREILKDLVTHAQTGYQDLLYLYHPSTQGQLENLGNRMLRLFGDANNNPDPELLRRFNAWGLDMDQARRNFQRWLDHDGITTYET